MHISQNFPPQIGTFDSNFNYFDILSVSIQIDMQFMTIVHNV